jgi:acyl carrier protein
MNTLLELQHILVKDYGLKPDQIEPDAVLTTLGLDSLGVLELMFKIEDHFSLKIADDAPTDLMTVNDVVLYIDGLLIVKKAASKRALDPVNA